MYVCEDVRTLLLREPVDRYSQGSPSHGAWRLPPTINALGPGGVSCEHQDTVTGFRILQEVSVAREQTGRKGLRRRQSRPPRRSAKRLPHCCDVQSHVKTAAYSKCRSQTEDVGAQSEFRHRAAMCYMVRVQTTPCMPWHFAHCPLKSLTLWDRRRT